MATIGKEIAPRVIGLDTLRASAIVLVLMTHYAFAGGKHSFGIAGDIGWAGVDLFFVLSGYLIGNQILSTFFRGESFSIKIFFARRLLRTLPNYYVMLALYWLLPTAPLGKTRASIGQFLTFTQNFGMHYGATFTHSWSLCIEEQFYLVLPLVAMLIAGSKRAVRLGWLTLVVMVVAGAAVRGMAWLVDGRYAISGFDFSGDIYYATFARFDELLPGVAIALLKNGHPTLFERVIRHSNIWLATGSMLVTSVLYWFHALDFPNTLPLLTLAYPLLASGFALLVLSALGSNAYLNRVHVPGTAALARWSYAIYLVHKPVFQMVADPIARMHLNADSPLVITAVMALGIMGGYLLFRLVETPFMRLRARWYPARNTIAMSALEYKKE